MGTKDGHWARSMRKDQKQQKGRRLACRPNWRYGHWFFCGGRRKNARNSCFADGTNGAWMGWEGGKAKWQIAGCPRMNGIWANDGGRGGHCLADLLSVWGVGRKDNSRLAPVCAEGTQRQLVLPQSIGPSANGIGPLGLLQVPSSLYSSSCLCWS